MLLITTGTRPCLGSLLLKLALQRSRRAVMRVLHHHPCRPQAGDLRVLCSQQCALVCQLHSQLRSGTAVLLYGGQGAKIEPRARKSAWH